MKRYGVKIIHFLKRGIYVHDMYGYATFQQVVWYFIKYYHILPQHQICNRQLTVLLTGSLGGDQLPVAMRGHEGLLFHFY